MNAKLAIETNNLRKRYGAIQVLDGLTLRLEEGEVYGLLGPNGAGKSTLIHLLLGFLRPDDGDIRVLGEDPNVARGRVGYLPERVRYHGHFTPREYLKALGSFSDLHGEDLFKRSQSVLELVGLAAVADRRLGTFSKGMLQRLGIAQALIQDPDLLLIDEPTSGLDPAGQREMIDLLGELRRQGHTILMCTHQLPEVEELCDRVGILSHNRMATEVRVKDLAIGRGATIAVRSSTLPKAALALLCLLDPAPLVLGGEIQVSGDDVLQRVLRILLDAGVLIAEVRPTGGGLEELYIGVTRGELPQKAEQKP